jgi:hypothetical protein
MKTSAPFFSPNASGKFGGMLVASKWKGRPYFRILTTPSNPSTGDQVIARLYLGSLAKGAHAVLTANDDVHEEGSQFFQDARDLAPSGQSWISFLQKHAKDVYDKTIVQWALIDATEKGYFTTGGTNLGLADYAPTLGDTVRTGLTKGQQVMALAFFANDYLNQDLADLLGTSPVAQDVADFVTYVQTTTWTA